MTGASAGACAGSSSDLDRSGHRDHVRNRHRLSLHYGSLNGRLSAVWGPPRVCAGRGAGRPWDNRETARSDLIQRIARRRSGIPVRQATYCLAARWLRRAAGHGHVKAQINIGSTYGNGHGVPGDLAAAYGRLAIAPRQGSEMAKEGVERLRKLMSGSEFAQGAKRATELWNRFVAPFRLSARGLFEGNWGDPARTG